MSDVPSWLPSSSAEQFQLAIKIIENAASTQNAAYDKEMERAREDTKIVREELLALQHENQALRKRATSVEKELADTNHAKDQLAEENRELHKQTLLYKQRIEKLEGVKRAVLTSLQDDENQWDYRTRGSMMTGMSSVPLVSPEPRVQSNIEHSPMDQHTSEEQEGTPSDEGEEGWNSGKEYFQRARMALPFDSFHVFLKHIKNLNNDLISKNECLAEARLIFGDTYHHLYVDLIQLLERHNSQGGSLL